MSLLNSPILTPSFPPISFFWGSSSGNDTNTIPFCSQFSINTFINPGASVAPVAPLYFIASPINSTSDTQLVPGDVGFNFTWIADFPVGTQFILAMSDGANSSGGSVGPYTISTSGFNNCTATTNETTISAVYDPPRTPCDEIDITVTGGIAPYTVTILSAQLGKYSNLTTSNNPIRLANTIAAGASFNLFVTDSTGESSIVSDSIISGLGQTTCSNTASSTPKPATTNSPSHSLSAIIGGAVGGILGSVILLLAVYFYYRRKKANEAYEKHQLDLQNNNSDFRMADGNVPLVTPFNMGGTHHYNSIGGNMSGSSDTNYNHAYAGLPLLQVKSHSGDEKSSMLGNGGIVYTSTSPHLISPYHYSPTQSSHPTLPHPPNPMPHSHSNSNSNSNSNNSNPNSLHNVTSNNSSNSTSPYQNYNNSTLPPLPTGLANPNDFEYRDSRTGY